MLFAYSKLAHSGLQTLENVALAETSMHKCRMEQLFLAHFSLLLARKREAFAILLQEFTAVVLNRPK